jgi:hypothetical protein
LFIRTSFLADCTGNAATNGPITLGVAGKKFARVQLLTVDGLLNGTQRAEHPDGEPDLNFKRANAQSASEQSSLR